VCMHIGKQTDMTEDNQSLPLSSQRVTKIFFLNKNKEINGIVNLKKIYILVLFHRNR
jgi:hypothetical protein